MEVQLETTIHELQPVFGETSSRLTKNRGLAQNYTDIIRQQLEAGIIEKV